MMLARSTLVFFLGCMLSGCSDKGSDSAEHTDVGGTDGPGTLAIAFEMDADYIAAMDEGEEPTGTFYGAVYRADDVLGTGPKKGAVPLESLELEIDLRPKGAPTATLHTTGDLDAGWVTILGFIDTDGNVDTSAPEPDSKDPVTVPGQNEFEVVSATSTPVVVYFGLLFPD